jgi:PAS domain S-box-containing protein
MKAGKGTEMINKLLNKIHDVLNKVWHSPVAILTDGKKKREGDRIICLLDKIETLHKQMRMYKIFWDTASVSLVLIRIADGMILDVNAAACSMYGYRKEEIVGKLTAFQFTTEPEAMRITFDEKTDNIGFRYHIRRNGHQFPIKAHMTYFNDQGYDVVAASIRELPNGDYIRVF